MDITETLAPRSDQQNFDDYLAGPRTVTVSAAHVVNGEQPVLLELAEYPGRPYKPNKSMRRVIAKAWGTETDNYVGRRLTLVGNPDVRYGGKAVGGIEIAAMSGLEKPLSIPLTETRGKKRQFTVQPLPDAPKQAPQPAQGGIPEKVQADTAKAIQDGTIDAYLTYLAENYAPDHIINYVTETAAKEQNA